ncbi:DUF167 domain-containing protein [Roseobacteraceae bacterium NS-SX3]
MGRPRKRDLPDLRHLAQPGAEIAVRVTPKASRNAIVADGEVLKVLVTAPPEDGKANEAVRRLLAAAIGTAASALVLKRGATARHKVFALPPAA